MAIKCKCGTYRRYGDEIAGRVVAPAMHLDACVNCGYVPPAKVAQRQSVEVPEAKPELGDRVANALEKVGAKKVTDAIHKATGFDCGCDKRRQRLNEFSRKFGKPNHG